MILNESRIEQTVDRDERGSFYKALVVAKVPDHHGSVPLAMVRKRAVPVDETRAPVLLIHGYGQNRYAWHLPSRSFSNYLARAGFDVFNLDLRGHGRSRHLGARLPAHVTEFVREDVPAAVEEIQKVSGNRPVYIIGHSLGGLIAYAASPRLGSALAGITTLGSPYQFTRGSPTLAILGWIMLHLDRRMPLGHGALELKGLGEAMRTLRTFIESPIFPLPIRGFVPRSMEPQVLSQHMSLAMDRGSITVLRNMFLRAAEWRSSGERLAGLADAEAFEALDIPLLVIAGTKDDLAPPSSVEPAYLRSRSSDKTYRAFPRGHIDLIMGTEAPLTIWPLIESWIGTRLRRRAQAA
ncbi:MAG: alpha/beta fold hydrolase [Polyangiaceae bacterium]|nr:alpha/beta fold hydrolase [Polyangiaceae bacterium]